MFQFLLTQWRLGLVFGRLIFWRFLSRRKTEESLPATFFIPSFIPVVAFDRNLVFWMTVIPTIDNHFHVVSSMAARISSQDYSPFPNEFLNPVASHFVQVIRKIADTRVTEPTHIKTPPK